MKRFQIVWRLLIDEIVQPVGKKQVGVAAPDHGGNRFRIVPGKIMLGERGTEAPQDISVIFARQGIAVILTMPCDKDLPRIARRNDGDPGRFRHGEKLQMGMFFYVLRLNRGIAGVRHIKVLVEAPQKRMIGVKRPVAENTRHFGRKRMLWNAVVEVKPGLSAPADMQC